MGYVSRAAFKEIIEDGRVTGYIIAQDNGEYKGLSLQQVYNELRIGNNIQRLSIDKHGMLKFNKSSMTEDYTDKYFGDWRVISYACNSNWLCECSCDEHVRKIIYIGDLKNGKSKSCGHAKKHNLKGVTFGSWEVLEYDKDCRWICKCHCEYCNGTVKRVHTNHLITGQTKSCGVRSSRFENLKGKKFGWLQAVNYIGDKKWECICNGCNRQDRVVVSTYQLTSGQTKSCGCKKTELMRKTMVERYGDINPYYTNRPREPWQIEAVSNAESMRAFIKNNMHRKPKINEICKILSLSATVACRKVKAFGLDDIVDKEVSDSKGERELAEYIESLCIGKYEVLRNDRKTLDNYELDIYIPELKIAAEFNGTYWHSVEIKGKKYHIDKSFMCSRHDIRLIHIFEYEWNNETQMKKIKELLRYTILGSDITIGARETDVCTIDCSDADKFIEKYHLQGKCSARINIALKYKEDIVAVMTFGTPRFGSDCEYEIIRLAFNSRIRVIGGAEKMLKFAKERYSMESIVSYCNIAKFSGGVYKRLGLSAVKLTEPNYVWASGRGYDVLKRQKTTKETLVNLGIGSIEETEDEIMARQGYLKVYDCGNIRYEWHRK